MKERRLEETVSAKARSDAHTPRSPASLRVAIAHEWLVRYAGSERCVAEMLEAFPGAELLTTVLETSAVPAVFRDAKPSLLQHLPGATRHHEWFLPLMPLAWRLREVVRDVDVVISSSHACAKAVRAEPGIRHLCYCHTPMRYAWDFDAERKRFPRAIRPLASAGMGWFRRWDRETAKRVTRSFLEAHCTFRVESSYLCMGDERLGIIASRVRTACRLRRETTIFGRRTTHLMVCRRCATTWNRSGGGSGSFSRL